MNVGDEYGRAARGASCRTRSPSTPTSRRSTGSTSSCAARFNRENAIGAALAARALGVDDDAIRRGHRVGRTACPGRFEAIDEGQPFTVIVDYAHTPDSLENVARAPRAGSATAG